MSISVIVNFLNVIVVNITLFLKQTYLLKKTLIFVNLVVSFHIYLYSVFKVHSFEMEAKKFVSAQIGGPEWTRTTDLTLIRRAL